VLRVQITLRAYRANLINAISLMEIVPVASRLKDVAIAMIGCSAYQATRTNNSTIYTKIFFNSYDLRLGTTVEGCVCNVWITTPKMCQEGLCAVKNGCEECSQRTYCVWCEEKGLCLPGGLFGPTDGSQCGEWTWYHCGGGTVPLIVLISSTDLRSGSLGHYCVGDPRSIFVRSCHRNHGHGIDCKASQSTKGASNNVFTLVKKTRHQAFVS
jgi:hypothetical protein